MVTQEGLETALLGFPSMPRLGDQTTHFRNRHLNGRLRRSPKAEVRCRSSMTFSRRAPASMPERRCCGQPS